MSAGTIPVEIQRFVAEPCLDFLLIEMVEHFYRSQTQTESSKEAAYIKLEYIGYRVGMALAER